MLNPSYLPDSNKIAQQVGPFNHAEQDPWPIWRLPENQAKWEWCQQNCQGKFDLTVPDLNGVMHWLFEKDTDAMAFVLKWDM